LIFFYKNMIINIKGVEEIDSKFISQDNILFLFSGLILLFNLNTSILEFTQI
jgi:hypothetical protein